MGKFETVLLPSNIDIDSVRGLVMSHAAAIQAPDNLLPGFGTQLWDSHPYIETDHRGWWYYVISERGHRDETLAVDTDHLLYLIFKDITFAMASQHELQNRMDGMDTRRLMFAKQEELLGMLNTKWQQRQREEHKRILWSHPFRDSLYS